MACCPHDEDFVAVATRLEMTKRAFHVNQTHVISHLLASLRLLCCFSFFFFFLLDCLLQPGPGGGVGAAAGAEGPSRKSQHVLGAPWSCHHQPLLGHQHPQGVCGRLWRQSVISTCRIFQSRQGSACAPGVEVPVDVQI